MRSDWKPAFILCMRRRSLLLAISRRFRFSFSMSRASGLRLGRSAAPEHKTSRGQRWSKDPRLPEGGRFVFGVKAVMRSGAGRAACPRGPPFSRFAIPEAPAEGNRLRRQKRAHLSQTALRTVTAGNGEGGSIRHTGAPCRCEAPFAFNRKTAKSAKRETDARGRTLSGATKRGKTRQALMAAARLARQNALGSPVRAKRVPSIAPRAVPSAVRSGGRSAAKGAAKSPPGGRRAKGLRGAASRGRRQRRARRWRRTHAISRDHRQRRSPRAPTACATPFSRRNTYLRMHDTYCRSMINNAQTKQSHICEIAQSSIFFIAQFAPIFKNRRKT